MRHQSVRFNAAEAHDTVFRFIQAGDYKNAEMLAHALLNSQPGHAPSIYHLGVIALETGRPGLAAVLLREAARAFKDRPEIWMTLGAALMQCAAVDEAVEAHKEAMRLEPMNALHPANVAGAMVNMGRYDEMIRYARKAYALDATNPHVRWVMALGHLEKGIITPDVWAWHEARQSVPSGNIKKRTYPGNPPLWDGTEHAALAVHGEQGLGDEIMFASCLPDMEVTQTYPEMDEGPRIVVECAPRLAELFARSFPGIHVIGTHNLEGKDLPEGFEPDAYCPLGSLPRLFRPSVESFPGTPYLIPDAEKVAEIRARLPEGKLRVGLAWQGGSNTTRIDLRSLHPEAFRPILGNDCDFVSLQYTKQAAADAASIGIHHWPEAEAEDMDDVAALVASCDLVITVCTTVVHLAGAMGVPCWVLVPKGHAWRYGGTGETMPWYRSVRLFRQRADWDETIRKVADGLADYRGQRAAA